MKDTFKTQQQVILDRQSRRKKKIHPLWQSLKVINLKRHFQKLDNKTRTIKQLKDRLASQIKRSQTIQAEQQEQLIQLAHQVKDYKQRLSGAGRAGTGSVEKQPVVAGPYFCDAGSLKRFKDDLTQFFSEKLGKDRLPNDQQWEMILSENPSTCVNAGAGSGKSTTLILRLYVMREYLRIPWKHISVFTFTKYSRWDLVEKLLTTFEKLGSPVTQLIAISVIRTFHSYACVLESRSTGRGRPTIFDLIGNDSKPREAVTVTPVDEEIDFSAEDIFDVESSLVAFQEDYKKAVSNSEREDEEEEEEHAKQALQEELKAIYHKAFMESEKFRILLKELFILSMSSGFTKSDVYNPNIGYLQKYDSYATRRAAKLFGDISEYEDVLSLDVAPTLVGDGANALFMSFNARITQTEQLILLVPENDERLPERSIPLSSFFGSKRNYLANCSDILPVIITSRAQLVDLAKLLRYYTHDEASKAPAFDYKPDGEISKEGSVVHIATRFFSLIQFVENFGLDFQSWASCVDFSTLSKGDQYFVAAAFHYHQYYCRYIRDKGYVSFNDLFLKIQPHKLDLVSESDLKTRQQMTHVLIDEFQDITPLYADYVKAIKQSLLLETGQAGSLLVVGDDYQSIYGWKGATVDIILRFANHFETYELPLLLKLENNHRCTQAIIDFAERIIEPIRPADRTQKKGISVTKAANAPLPRIFIIPDKNFIRQIVNFIRDEMEIVQPTSEHPMLVLSRHRKTLAELKSFFKDDERIQMMTFHASKGLEGRSVVLVGDCQYWGRNWIKNDVLRQFFGSKIHGDRIYDRMQTIESLRLAYVAATRAARRCHWILKEEDDESRYSELRKHLMENSRAKVITFDLKKCCENTRLAPSD